MKHEQVQVKLAEAKAAKSELDRLRYLLKTGSLPYDEVRSKAVEPLARLNEGMAIVAKQHGFRHRPVHFAGLMR